MTTAPTSRHAANDRAAHADALEILRGDHEQARALADECRRFARSVSPEQDIQGVAETLCRVLRMLSEIEEDLFYPAARAALAPEVLALARLEHATAKAIIRQLQLTDPGEPRYEALLVALSDCVERHVQHEQSELFPRVRAAHLDLDELGDRMNERQEEWRAHH
jgi:hypothetical protein